MMAARLDHLPICLEWARLGEFVKWPFKFEKFWMTHPVFKNLMKEWWLHCPAIEGSRMYIFQQKLKYIKDCLKKWNRESFGNIFQEKNRL